MARDATSAGGTDPLREYGLIEDGHSAALVSPRANVDGWCAPRFDSDPVFDALLGGDRSASFGAEEIDAATGAFLGNHPQAISHAAHLGAAHALCAREGRARDREALA